MTFVSFLKLCQTIMLLGYDKKVHRGLGVDVAKSQCRIILINDISGNVLGYNFIKNSGSSRCCSPGTTNCFKP